MQDRLNEQKHKVSYPYPPIAILPLSTHLNRLDECKNWLPLIEKCRGIVFVYLLENAQDRHPKDWESVSQALKEFRDRPFNYTVIIFEHDQEALTQDQITALKKICQTFCNQIPS